MSSLIQISGNIWILLGKGRVLMKIRLFGFNNCAIWGIMRYFREEFV